MLKLVRKTITNHNSENKFTGVFVFSDDNNMMTSYVYNNDGVLRISLFTQVGCNCNCSYCIPGKNFKRNLTTDELKNQLDVILKELEYTNEQYPKVVIDTKGVGEPFMNWKNVEPFIEYCYNKKYSEFHLYTIGIAYTDIQDRTIKMGVKYPGFHVHLTLTDIDDVKRNSYFIYKKLPYMILRKMVDYANRFKHYTKKSMHLNYYMHGKENKNDFEMFKQRFNSMIIDLNCIIPDNINTEYVDTMLRNSDRMIEEMKSNIVVGLDKELIYLESCLFKNNV